MASTEQTSGNSLFGNQLFACTSQESVSSKDITHIAAGAYNTAYLTDDGELFTAGDNQNGQLGNKHSSGSVTRVDALDLYKIKHASYGQAHALAVTDQGALFSWGAGEWGQLGTGSEGPDQPQPRLVKGSKELKVVRVAAGACHSLTLTSSGQVHACGQGTFGALGLGLDPSANATEDFGENKPTLQLVKTLWPVGVIQVICWCTTCGCASVTIKQA